MRVKKTLHIAVLVLLLGTMSGCEKMFMDSSAGDSATEVFEYLWKQVDERYSLFDVKEVDWNAMHDSLRPQVYDGMGNDSLFRVLGKMLNSLNDGHVDLWSGNDVASSEQIFLQRYGKGNFDLNTVALHYLRPDHHTTGGMAYNSIAGGKVVYVRYSTFSNSASTSEFKKILDRYPDAEGLVFDIRQNGGGAIQNEWNLMALLPGKGQLLYSTQMKSGPGHNDFGELKQVHAPANGDNKPYRRPVVLLTDRGCYSAASSFALCLKSYDNVTVVGDTTAGGLAIPAGGALPNGWYYRFGVSRTIAPDGVNYEQGVPPDVVVTLSREAVAAGRDNIIDSACSIILNQTTKHRTL